MDKVFKLPEGFLNEPYKKTCFKFQGCIVIESCPHLISKKGSMFLEDHLLLFVLQGTYTIRYNNQVYTIHKNEMVLLKKAIAFEYLKAGDIENDNCTEFMMFFIQDDFLKEFAQMTQFSKPQSNELIPVSTIPVNNQLCAFIQSLKPFFSINEQVDAGLIKLKMLELLYGLASTDKNLLQQLLQLKQQIRTDISYVMESNFTNPISLDNLAYLSGRSLSSFKRDFKAIYNTSPAQWVREKRLKKASELLKNTSMSVADVCYSVGFENSTHFSRVFKNYYGYPPSSLKQN